MKKRSTASEVYLILMTVLMYLPILIVMAYSFNESKLSSVWSGFSLTWYADLFRDRDIGTALINSLILGVLSSLAAAVIGTLGAIGTQRTSFRGKGVMEYIATLPMMTPEIILGMLFLAFFSLLGLPFGMMTLVISHTAFCIPYVFMQVKARLAGMDKSYEEAARDLGAGPVLGEDHVVAAGGLGAQADFAALAGNPGSVADVLEVRVVFHGRGVSGRSNLFLAQRAFFNIAVAG